MKTSITRRDFLNGTQLALGAALTAPIITACGAGETPIPTARLRKGIARLRKFSGE